MHPVRPITAVAVTANNTMPDKLAAREELGAGAGTLLGTDGSGACWKAFMQAKGEKKRRDLRAGLPMPK